MYHIQTGAKTIITYDEIENWTFAAFSNRIKKDRFYLIQRICALKINWNPTRDEQKKSGRKMVKIGIKRDSFLLLTLIIAAALGSTQCTNSRNAWRSSTLSHSNSVRQPNPCSDFSNGFPMRWVASYWLWSWANQIKIAFLSYCRMLKMLPILEIQFRYKMNSKCTLNVFGYRPITVEIHIAQGKAIAT